MTADARLILREDELDASIELFILAEAALWSTAEAALEGHPSKLGRGHYRAALLLKRRPGIGVQDLAALTGLSKQGASRIFADLERAGYIDKAAGRSDGRRKPARLTPEGEAFEARVSERLRHHLALAYRSGGLESVAGARRILAATAGARLRVTAAPDGDRGEE
jgi:DNA-binding MarR family transcriptional regulator